MAGRYNNSVQCGSTMWERAPIKAGRLGATSNLATVWGGINNIWETMEIFREVWEKSAAVDSAEQNSKGILPSLRHRNVDMKILSTRDFCWGKSFVNARFLSTWEFCQHENFVNARILSTPIISVDANILSPTLFFRRQYFVAAYFLSVFRLRIII